MLEVVEKFVSINGEGTHAGEPAVFVRFKGCNLSCSYCDTKWANEPNVYSQPYSVEELVKWIDEQGIYNVTLTGGEPLLQGEIGELIEQLTEHRTEIETNGSVPLSDFAKLGNRPVFTMDYKLPSSGMEKYMDTDNFYILNKDDTVKFVSGSEEDLNRALEIIREYDLTTRCHIYFSPVFGKIEPSKIVEFMLKNKLDHVRIQLQLHKFIWSPDKRGV